MVQYDFSELTYSQTFSMIPINNCITTRKIFNLRKKEFKRALITRGFYTGYFDTERLTQKEIQYLEDRIIPKSSKGGHAEPLMNIHHIVPISFGGTNVSGNLILIPTRFHSFIHSHIIDRQIQTDKSKPFLVKGLPDFNKITLDMMMDNNFIFQYAQYLQRLIPNRKITRWNPNIRLSDQHTHN